MNKAMRRVYTVAVGGCFKYLKSETQQPIFVAIAHRRPF